MHAKYEVSIANGSKVLPRLKFSDLKLCIHLSRSLFLIFAKESQTELQSNKQKEKKMPPNSIPGASEVEKSKWKIN